MGIKNLHPDYVNMVNEWEKADAFFTSEKKVHNKGITYLPKLSGMSDDDYDSYKKRASLSMYFKKVIMTYLGMVFRKPFLVDENGIEDFLEKVTTDKKSFEFYIYNLLKEFFIKGRCGTLIDLPRGFTNENPYLVLYKPESIINWGVDGNGNLEFVVLKEIVKKNNDDRFDTSVENQYRLLVIEDGVYKQKLYNEREELIDEVDILIDNKSLDYIPFIIHGGIFINSIFLTEILDLNLHHYQLSADLAHGLHFTGLPTPVITGMSAENTELYIGSSKFLILEDSEATAFYLEYKGEGLKQISDKLKQIEETISSLAINMVLNANNKMTATQSTIDHGTMTSSLNGVVKQLSQELTVIVNIVMDWIKKENRQVVLNTDFISKKLNAQELTALVNSYLQNAISEDLFYYNLQQGELLPDSFDIDDERRKKEENPLGLE